MRNLRGILPACLAVAGMLLGGASSALPLFDESLVARPPCVGCEAWRAPKLPGLQPGIAHANVVSPDGSTLYVTGEAPNGEAFATDALDAATGLRKWRAAPSAEGYDKSWAIAVDPAGQRVYTSGTIGGPPGEATFALDPPTGRVLWSARLQGYDLAVAPDGARLFLSGLDPALGQVVVAALDAWTGATLWEQPLGGTGWWAARVAVAHDGQRVFALGPERSAAFDAATGATLWVGPTRGFVSSTLLTDATDTTLFIAGNSAYPGGLEVGAYDAATGARRWAKGGWGDLALAPDGSLLILAGGMGWDWGVLGLDPATGDVVWRAAVGARFLAVDALSNVVFAAGEGLFALDGTTGRELWRSDGFPAPEYLEALAASPAGARVFLSGTDNAGALDYETFAFYHRLPRIALQGV